LIHRNNAQLSANPLKDSLEVEVDRLNPFAVNYIFAPVDGTVVLTIYRGHAGSYVTYWKGMVSSVKFKSQTAIITVNSKISSLKRFGLMRKYLRSCSYPLYSPRCTKSKTDYRVPGVVLTVLGIDVTATAFGTKSNGWFTGGWFESGGCSQMIVHHVGTAVKLAHRMRDLKIGDSFLAYAGCDHSSATCKDKFGNKLNYGGQEYIPTKNPFVGDSVETGASVFKE
jgi:uncharacterized phage protein (TIGR02218 family)